MAKTKETKIKKLDATNKARDFLSKHKINDYTTILDDSPYSKTSNWISSGSYSLNRVLSGSYFKGFASNRLYVVAGPSGAGKTVVAGNTTRNAQEDDYTVAYFDSENAIDKESMNRMGVDTDSLIYIPIRTISDLKNQAIDLIRKWREEYGPDAKLMMICDSLGGMAGTKEMNDIEEQKHASDMGQRAKELRSTARLLTIECGQYNVPMICTNHTYEQPAANPQAAPVTKMVGGEGFMYAASGVIYLKKRAVREAEKNAAGDNVKVKKGNILIAVSEKNRFVPEGTSGEIYLDFTRGLSQYYGLLNDALEFGYFEKKGPRIEVKHLNKSLFETQIYNKEVFGPILNELNEKVEAKYKFSNMKEDDLGLKEELGETTEPQDIDSK